jgi:hypothetical protein
MQLNWINVTDAYIYLKKWRWWGNDVEGDILKYHNNNSALLVYTNSQCYLMLVIQNINWAYDHSWIWTWDGSMRLNIKTIKSYCTNPTSRCLYYLKLTYWHRNNDKNLATGHPSYMYKISCFYGFMHLSFWN